MKTNPALSALRHHVTGAIARGEAQAITEVPASKRPEHTPGPWILSASFDRVERRVKHGDNPPLVWGIASGINSAHPDYLPRAELTAFKRNKEALCQAERILREEAAWRRIRGGEPQPAP